MNRILLQLLKTGDIISLLPLCYADAQKGERDGIVVHKDYASVLDGVSYCEKIVWSGSIDDLKGATAFAEGLCPEVKVTQVIGPADVARFAYERAGLKHAITDSFQKEAWNLAGRLGDMRHQHPLVFDQRDKEREAKLRGAIPTKKKSILVAAGGASSPFPYRDLLLELLRLKFSRGYNIVDISNVRSDRVYDLLGLFEDERVHCLIATDSAPLHLAHAVPLLPVVALINDKPSFWHGSMWRKNHIAHIRYGDFAKRATEMLDAIADLHKYGCPFSPIISEPKLVHVWSQYDVEEDTKEHAATAKATWKSEYATDAWVKCPVEVGACGRDSKNRLKDDKRFPFVKDVVRLGTQRANDNDLIVFTRADTCFTAGLTQKLKSNTETPYFSHRSIKNGNGATFHPAIDLFAFTKKWWREHQAEFPDMILGKDSKWNRVFYELIRKHGGRELPFAVYRTYTKQVPMTEAVPPRFTHNEKLEIDFLKAHQLGPLIPEVGKQVPLTLINRRALHPFGYNGSLIEHNGRHLLAYRWHSENTASTRLAVADLDAGLSVARNANVFIPDINEAFSVEDPRLFTFNNKLCVAYVVSTWPKKPLASWVHYGELSEHNGEWRVNHVIQPKIGKNDGTAMEKNFVLWDWNGKLLCIYSGYPEQVIYELHGSDPATVHKSPVPHWPWGSVRAGTTPMPYKGKLLRFVHSRLDNEPAPYPWRYYIAACVMEPEPPFQIINISQSPIIRGSELDDLTETEKSSCISHKENVAFPMQAIQRGDEFLLSLGINDCLCAVARLKEEHLNL